MQDWINNLGIGWRVALWAALAIVVALAAWLGTKLNKRAFKKIQEKHSGIHLKFFEKVNSALIVLFCLILGLSVLSGTQTVWQTIFGGTAIVSAVLIFAAQDTIKDILAGLMISVYKPFEIGDRIVLEDGSTGVVENITLRHVVLRGVDMLRLVVPNSRINSMQISNFSYESPLRSAQFRFPVGYDSDMEQVKQVIAAAVEESGYSVPGKMDADAAPAYGQVYFLSFADSALIMAVTVYFEKKYRSEIVIDDINTRVREALIAHDIEIPYNYINVVNVDGKKG